MTKEVPVLVRVLDVACLDAAADALTDRGMRVFWRKRGGDQGLISGSIAPALLPTLRLVGGCRVLREGE